MGAICFEIRIPRKKNKELLREVSTKIYGNYFIMEKNKNIFWFLNNSEYHHQEMRLLTSFCHKSFHPEENILWGIDGRMTSNFFEFARLTFSLALSFTVFFALLVI